MYKKCYLRYLIKQLLISLLNFCKNLTQPGQVDYSIRSLIVKNDNTFTNPFHRTHKRENRTT